MKGMICGLLVCIAGAMCGQEIRSQSVTEYVIPRANAFPHDPAVTAEGNVWYTDQQNSYIGKLDPSTGSFIDFPTPTPNSGPHGIDAGPDGFIWYTAQNVGRLGKVNPSTGNIQEFVLPAQANRPHTPLWHGRYLWYTAQTNNTYARFDPATGTTEVFPAPSSSLPYGIAAAPDGFLWIALFGTNKLGRVDTVTGAMELFTLPNSSARPRRLAVKENGHVYYTDYQRGYLGRYDPQASQFREWLAPDIPPGPYGIAIGNDGRVWFNCQGTSAMFGFDPATEQFDTVVIPTSGAIVRHMVCDRQRGTMWLALSGTQRIGRLEGVTGIRVEGVGTPEDFVLKQNYPNPFNPSTTIRFDVPSSGNPSPVSLRVYDLLCREVATLVNEEKAPGTYSIYFDASGLSSGVYVYRLYAGRYSTSRRMVVLK